MENETEGVTEVDPAGETLGQETLEVAETQMPQLDIGLFPNLIFWLVVALVALYFVLTRVALPRMNAILAERNDAIANDLEQAAVFKRRAQEAENTYNEALRRAREEAQKIAADNKAQIGKELDTLMAKADAEIAARSAESQKRIREIEASAVESVTEVARSVAAEIVASLGPRPAEEAAVNSAVAARLGG